MTCSISSGYTSGIIGRIVFLHATWYAENWNFGRAFETRVAGDMARFFERFDESRDGFWHVSGEGCIQGSVALDGKDAETDGAHLRWFIVDDFLKGKGQGRALLRRAIDFGRDRGYPFIWLSTFRGLDAARRLYETEGFKLVFEEEGKQWGTVVQEQRFELHF